MHPGTTATTKRAAAAVIAAVLVLFAAAVPAASACCAGKAPITIAAMHASMACCADQCTMSNPESRRDHDVTLTPAPPAAPAASAVASLVLAPATIAAGAIPVNDHGSQEFSPPPPFLINSQFRI